VAAVEKAYLCGLRCVACNSG